MMPAAQGRDTARFSRNNKEEIRSSGQILLAAHDQAPNISASGAKSAPACLGRGSRILDYSVAPFLTPVSKAYERPRRIGLEEQSGLEGNVLRPFVAKHLLGRRGSISRL